MITRMTEGEKPWFAYRIKQLHQEMILKGVSHPMFVILVMYHLLPPSLSKMVLANMNSENKTIIGKETLI